MLYQVRMFSKEALLSILAILVTIFISTCVVAEEAPSFSLLDARQKGVFKTDQGEGYIRRSFDETVKKDVLKFEYSGVSKGSAIGVWTEGFSPDLGTKTVNAVKIGVNVPTPAQLQQISVTVEIAGKRAVQRIPLSLESGWNSVQKPINWNRIGDLKEIVFIVRSIGKDKSVDGTLYFDVDFHKVKDSSRLFDTGEQGISERGSLKGHVSHSFSQQDAGDMGVFNIGLALGGLLRSFDETLKRDVLEFDYSLPKGSIIGIWTKNYPPDLEAATVDAIRVGVRVPHPDQLREVSVRLEIKGTSAMQKIPLQLEAGWNYFREAIDWNTIGRLKEIVFVINPMTFGPQGSNPMWFDPTGAGSLDGEKPAEGILYFDFDFYKLTFLQKNLIFIKVSLVLLLSFLVTLMFTFSGRVFNRYRASNRSKTKSDESNGDSREASILSRIKRDFLYGIAAVLIIGGALSIYSMGTISPLRQGFSLGFLGITLLGAVIAALLKFVITGKHLTPFEVFQNMLLTGLLAASSSRLGILQAPSTWTHLLTLNKVIATLAFMFYHVFNARSLALSGKHLRATTSVSFIGIPYLFNWLLLLQNAALLQTLSNTVSAGLLASWPVILEMIGRVLVVFGFNEAVANGIGLVTKKRLLRTSKAHIFIFFVSLGVVISPLIADLGSTAAVASMPVVVRTIIILLTTMFSFAGLWGEIYLITGMALDAGHRTEPSWDTISKHVSVGMKKGMAYSGIVMMILYTLRFFLNAPISQIIVTKLPVIIGTLAGALVFPVIKTIVETFDGSLPFFQRIRHSCRDASLYARGAIVGFGFSYGIVYDLFRMNMPERIMFGLSIGLLASAGVSVLRDVVYAARGQGRIQSWRLYFTDALLGIFVGSAAAFYLDSRQVPVVIEKFKLYTSSGFSAMEYITYPLVNKWGRIDLGTYTGGVKLIFTESLAGVINWSIAAWLFAINKVFLVAIFEKQTAPIKFFFSKAGFTQLIEHMIYVLRWGLWMSPIIFTFLRMMPDPTWYNQDGAIRTLFATYHSLTMVPGAFRQWSLDIFVYIMAIDFFRVLIWMDHMGLRVATLVNLSFIGLDRLDERIARFIGPATAQRYIPEAVKRFCTWGPLLIPFYLPRGNNWDYVWSTAEAMQSARRGGMLSLLQSLTLPEKLLLTGLAILACTGISFGIRSLRRRSRRRVIKSYELGNREYRVFLKENGEIYSEVDHHKSGVFPPEYDISRRSYDIIDPCGRVLYLVDTSEAPQSKKRSWPVVGNFPKDRFKASRIERGDNSLKVVNTANGIRTTINITLADLDTTAELWKITVENLTYNWRKVKVIPYLEWVLNGGIHDRFHTQYARLFP
ncbi:MAG: hypothetical protein ISS92_05995, partial [Candidatus Omnitrophica bacterium]|nr:hypothetical protein [Candidatus Omnitrophota bacterium]